MNTLSNLLHDALPLLGVILLVIGIKTERINYIVAALWLSLIALLLHYQTAGGEILGTYFGYKNASIYTLNLLVLITALLYLFFKFPLFQGKLTRYSTRIASTCLVVGSFFLLSNLWINAAFIESKHSGTPILQVATFSPLNYCKYRYIYYKINVDGKISYMCPNHYGIIPSIGYLDVAPDFILSHLARQINMHNKMGNKQQ